MLKTHQYLCSSRKMVEPDIPAHAYNVQDSGELHVVGSRSVADLKVVIELVGKLKVQQRPRLLCVSELYVEG
jgi:hypothetical protein